MKALGMIEVFSFTTAVYVADIAAKAADVKVIAFDRNRPKAADAPAPLVMIVKIEGNVSAVRAAVEAGSQYAKDQGKFIVSHIIANPAETVEKMGYLMDINKDKFNKKLPKNFIDAETGVQKKSAIGLVEVQGLVAAIEGLDSMLKTSDVRLIHTEKRLGGRLVTFVITGSVSAVKAAVENGVASASALGAVYGNEVIPNPHDEIIKFFDFGGEE
jgi:microcompartment protein CcmL/EutN